ncbi:SF1B family DNA helicase RecD2 [Comamonas thiooxydans]|uniref:SF1B family DNA helicase RecD2 n=1 Tax=Comamonas thiooxydans TaxID=363952 RepID=UPI000B418E70|nr:AAA family ATPase [Comamonas thiooxydans]
MTPGSVEQLVFQVAQIVFSKDGFNIVRSTTGANISGKFNAKEGYCYTAEGHWETHPTYGPQYKLSSASMVKMTSPEATGRFLVYQLRGKGVGELVISNIVAGCKDDGADLEELLDKLDRTTLIAYVGTRNAKKVDLLLSMWPKIKPAADLMSPLLGYGLSEAVSETLVNLYGNKALEVVESDPYSLIQRVDGVGFLKADQIANKVGIIQKTDSKRLRAALATGLRDATASGDIGVRRTQLIAKTMPLVNEAVVENGRRKLDPEAEIVVPEDLLAKVLDAMIAGTVVEKDGSACEFSSRLIEFADEKGEVVVWYKPLAEAEANIAAQLAALNAPARKDLVALIDEVALGLGAVLAPQQRDAIEMALTRPVSIITGGPGVGKSYMQAVLLKVLDRVGQRGFLCAPTGKAAKRIKEATGRPASTIHSLIGFAGNRVAFNKGCPLVADYLIIDESSMADTELLALLLLAMPSTCRVIFVGDVDQLPSVGPGQVLRDMIRSGCVAVTRLTKGFRFSGGIAEAARAINSGRTPETTADRQFVFHETDEPAQALMKKVKELLTSGVNPDDIQVLAPVHKGDAGCTSLNLLLQTIFNPEPRHGSEGQRIRRDSGDIRVGDRVIQGKNDRETGLVNGDIGWVDSINSTTGDVELTLPDRDKPVVLKKNQTTHLKLAYCITVHKSQGAEAPYVLIALDKGATFMLTRELVYTGETRGKLEVDLFANINTLTRAVRKGQPPEGTRRTFLVSRLRSCMPILATEPVSGVRTDSLAAAMLTGCTGDEDI